MLKTAEEVEGGSPIPRLVYLVPDIPEDFALHQGEHQAWASCCHTSTLDYWAACHHDLSPWVEQCKGDDMGLFHNAQLKTMLKTAQTHNRICGICIRTPSEMYGNLRGLHEDPNISTVVLQELKYCFSLMKPIYNYTNSSVPKSMFTRASPHKYVTGHICSQVCSQMFEMLPNV